MIQERIVEILMYVLNEVQKTKKPLGEIDLSSLMQKGYTQEEIITAFTWLQDRLKSDVKFLEVASRQQSASFRILHSAEKYVIPAEAFGYLIQLHQLNIITEAELELVIERSMLSGFEQLTVDEIKAIVASIVFDMDRDDFKRGRIFFNSDNTIN